MKYSILQYFPLQEGDRIKNKKTGEVAVVETMQDMQIVELANGDQIMVGIMERFTATDEWEYYYAS